MNEILALLIEMNLLQKNQTQLDQFKTDSNKAIMKGKSRLYPASLYTKDGILYCMGFENGEKSLYLTAHYPFQSGFEGEKIQEGEYRQLRAPLTIANAEQLHRLFPFSRPVSLRNKRSTIGCGDRLGLASAAHIRAIRQFDAFPVLAQQSIRELNFTGRTFKEVVADASFLVFQEGYEEGWGADGDHLKTIDDIDTALEAGMPMITLDLTEVLNPEAGEWEEDRVDKNFSCLDIEIKTYIEKYYFNRDFDVGGHSLHISSLEAKRCALMYWNALEFAAVVNRHLSTRRGDQYDLEISIDETTFPTLPEHHLFIAKELQGREVPVNSLAPRFVGDFQKAVDYIGDPQEFERQFIVHCDISRSYGEYKISIHSGSDKFSVYPYIGRHSEGRLHLKTAGTSWLEALRTIARSEPDLYRSIHRKAAGYYQEALKSYHITADLKNIPPLDSMEDSRLEEYLNIAESRQMLHITYGGLLNDSEIREAFFSALQEHEDLHYQIVQEHFVKHLTKLGLPRR